MDIYQKMKSEAEGVADGAEEYFQLQKERIKLEVIDRLTMSMTDVIYLMAVGMFVYGGLLLLCIALGLVVQEVTDNWIISALSATFAFGLMAFITIRYGKDVIRDTITKTLIKSLYE